MCVFLICVSRRATDACQSSRNLQGSLKSIPEALTPISGQLCATVLFCFVCVFFSFFLFSLFLLLPILVQQVLHSKFNSYKRDLEAQCVCVCVSKSTLVAHAGKRKISTFMIQPFIFPPSPKDYIFRLANGAGQTLTLTNCLL